MLTVGRLAAKYGLSRSTLLYYSRIGLLRPRARSAANYRLYSEADEVRLGQICRYRAAGVPLAEIGELLGTKGAKVAVLERRLAALDAEIAALREQQRVVLGLLGQRRRLAMTRALDKQRWVALLRAAGLSDDDMDRWHVEFERREPQAHQDFLESLGILPAEVRAIRRWSRAALRRAAG